ncbi:hypothetical protein A2590_02920 [Candidatus Adlerbacteria bacterium RIFOXYD1_FULL_48_8]|nr:MAG: hypothetical protein A2590_02920 [Candidatus Adlerbacteria bacterium RIFOXYD1_FULL_48_8]
MFRNKVLSLFVALLVGVMAGVVIAGALIKGGRSADLRQNPAPTLTLDKRLREISDTRREAMQRCNKDDVCAERVRAMATIAFLGHCLELQGRGSDAHRRPACNMVTESALEEMRQRSR